MVSVLMTAYNREQFIGEAIESVLASDYADFELIIVDDGSKDNTINIAKHYEQQDKRIRVYINETNLGDYPNRNKATTYAQGEFIMFVDSDDRIYPDSIAYCVSNMQNNPQANFGMLTHLPLQNPKWFNPAEAIHNHFFKKPFLSIGPGGTIIKRVFFEEIGRYPVRFGPANDMYFNLKAAAEGGVLIMPYHFLYYRIHEGQEINDKYSYLYLNYNYLNAALEELNLPLNDQQKNWIRNKNKKRFLVNIVRYYYKTRNWGNTMMAVGKAGFGVKDAFKAIFHKELSKTTN